MTTSLAALLARRALVLWALVHVLAEAVAAAGRMPPGGSVGAALPAVATAVFAIDLARRGERTLLANLGAGLPAVLGIAAAAGGLAELALVLALGAAAR